MENASLHQHPDEKEWINGLIRKDKSILEAFYNYYAPSLYGLILKASPDEREAARLLCLIFLRIVREISQYDPNHCSLFTWMIRITLSEIPFKINNPNNPNS